MSEIIIATVVVAVVGILIAYALVAAGKKFHIDVDERVTQVRECLPGNNCGACGFAGCDAVAAAIAAGKTPVNTCPVCSASAVAAIGKIMGVEAEAQQRKVAFVHCSGTCTNSPKTFTYVGVQDCRSAVFAGLSARNCADGCLGFGSCVSACPQGAIEVRDGVAVVNQELCVGCGICTKTCPKNLISLIPVGVTNTVRCSSHARGPAVKKVCSAGCIGCGMCVRKCPNGAVTLVNNLAVIDPEKCTGCGACAEKCPAHVIVEATPSPESKAEAV